MNEIQQEVKKEIDSIEKRKTLLQTIRLSPEMKHAVKKSGHVMMIAVVLLLLFPFLGKLFPDGSIFGIVGDTAYAAVTSPIQESKILSETFFSTLIMGKPAENMQQRVYEIDKKMKSGEKLTSEDIGFVKTLSQTISLGAAGVGLFTSAKLFNYYYNGNGGDLEVDSSVFTDTGIVQYASDEMVKYLLKKKKNKKFPLQGSILSNQVLTKKYLSIDNKGYSGKGEIQQGTLTAGQETRADKDLYFAVHRFHLKADYAFNKDTLSIKWSVRDVYDFEQSDKKTYIPLPRNNKLAIPHTFNNNLIKEGLAEEFTTVSSWETVQTV